MFCLIFQMRDLQKNVLPRIMKLCMEMSCLCPFQGHKYGHWKPTETSVFEFSYYCVNSSLEELIKIKVILILFWNKECLDSKISKIGNVFNPHKSFPGRQLNTASHKARKFKRPVSQNKEPFWTENLFVLRCCNTTWK